MRNNLLKILVVGGIITAVLLVSGCTENTKTIEIGDGKIEIEQGENWCQQGNSWKFTSPQGGEEYEGKILGMETMNGIQMCKVAVEFTDKNTSRVEFAFSEDGETQNWKFYDSQNRLKTEWNKKMGKMHMVQYDEEGNVINEVDPDKIPLPGGMQK